MPPFVPRNRYRDLVMRCPDSCYRGENINFLVCACTGLLCKETRLIQYSPYDLSGASFSTFTHLIRDPHRLSGFKLAREGDYKRNVRIDWYPFGYIDTPSVICWYPAPAHLYISHPPFATPLQSWYSLMRRLRASYSCKNQRNSTTIWPCFGELKVDVLGGGGAIFSPRK